MPRKKASPGYPSLLVNDDVPLAHRRRMLAELCMNDSEENTAMLQAFIKAVQTRESPRSVYQKKTKELESLMLEIRSGPLREAAFLGLRDGNGVGTRACVALEDGTRAFVMVPEKKLAEELRCGDTVLIEANGKAVISRNPHPPDAGETARFERQLDERRIEVSLRDQERHVYLVAADLAAAIADGRVEPGATLLVCPRRLIAFSALPPADGLSHFRFLDRGPVPDVVVDRDLAAPPAYIEQIAEFVRTEMLHPETRRRFRLPRCEMRFLSGTSGSGKTFSLMALHRRIYEVIAAATGDPLESLPPRVLRLRPGRYLSQWLGVADQNLERFFDEVEQLAAAPYVAADGRKYELPVLVVIEEVDGLARRRGEEAIYDRIMTTALQRLDPSRPQFRDSFVVVIATSNVPQQCDPAFLRRVSGQVERFGRLGRAAFCGVLAKHLRGLPVAGGGGHGTGGGFSDVASGRPGNGAGGRAGNGNGAGGREQALAAELASWLFRPEERDRPLLEISLAGSAQPLRRYRRDLLTASVVERAVQQAARAACARSGANGEIQPLTNEGLAVALRDQLEAVAALMNERNAADYVDIPEGARVVGLRRVEQPRLLAHQLSGVA